MAKIVDGLVLNGQPYEFVSTDVNLADVETNPGAASKEYAVGEHLILEGLYYVVIAPIAENDGLVIDTNIRAETVGNEITGLRNSFSQALTDLKATPIAQAVGAVGTTFASVISKLGEIVNRGAWTANMANTGSVTIPAGYHDGTGTVKTSGTANVTTNGTHNIAQYSNVNVNVLTYCDTVGGSGSPWWTAYFPGQIYMYRFIICHGANWQYIILRNNTPRTGNSWVIQQVENFTYQGISGNSIQFAQTQNASSGYRAYGIY